MRHYASPAGIYRVRNRSTGEVYIGRSLNIYRRIRHHMLHLQSGRHCNRRLQEDWALFGPKGFSWSILEVIAPNGDLKAAEWRWCEIMQTQAAGLYNSAPIRPPVEQLAREATDIAIEQLALTGRRYIERIQQLRAAGLTLPVPAGNAERAAYYEGYAAAIAQQAPSPVIDD